MPPLRSFTWSFSLYAMQRLRVIPCAAKRSVSTDLIQLYEWTQHPVCPPQAVPFTAHKPREHPWNKKKHHPCPNQNHCANGTAYVSNDSKYLFFFNEIWIFKVPQVQKWDGWYAMRFVRGFCGVNYLWNYYLYYWCVSVCMLSLWNCWLEGLTFMRSLFPWYLNLYLQEWLVFAVLQYCNLRFFFSISALFYKIAVARTLCIKKYWFHLKLPSVYLWICF